MKDITSQQAKVLNCIQLYIKKTGFPPTRADICRELGFKSPNSAETHLRALEKKGFISIESGTSRGIAISNPETAEEEDLGYPIIGLVAAGSPTLATENIEKNVKCPKDFFGSNFDYFLRVKGLSMKDAGIQSGDIMLVDKSLTPKNRSIVLAVIDGEFTVKRVNVSEKELYLMPENENFPPIKITEEMDFQVWGVVTYIIHKAL